MEEASQLFSVSHIFIKWKNKDFMVHLVMFYTGDIK